LSSYVGGRVTGSGYEKGQLEFREKLISQLFELARAEEQISDNEQHIRVLRARKHDCIGCGLTGQARKPENARHLVRYQLIRALENGQGRRSMDVRPAISHYIKKALEILKVNTAILLARNPVTLKVTMYVPRE
jgi:hypothetical protein